MSTMTRVTIFGLLLGLQSVFAAAQAVPVPPAPHMVSRAETLSVGILAAPYERKPAVGVGQSRMVVYSLPEDGLAGATSLFVNGRYHASLVKGAYSDLCYSSGTVELGLRQAEVGTQAKDMPDSVLGVPLLAGQTHYLRVVERQGRPVLQVVQAVQAEQELQGKRLQVHTLSRVAQACPPALTGAADGRQSQ